MNLFRTSATLCRNPSMLLTLDHSETAPNLVQLQFRRSIRRLAAEILWFYVISRVSALSWRG